MATASEAVQRPRLRKQYTYTHTLTFTYTYTYSYSLPSGRNSPRPTAIHTRYVNTLFGFLCRCPSSLYRLYLSQILFLPYITALFQYAMTGQIHS